MFEFKKIRVFSVFFFLFMIFFEKKVFRKTMLSICNCFIIVLNFFFDCEFRFFDFEFFLFDFNNLKIDFRVLEIQFDFLI